MLEAIRERIARRRLLLGGAAAGVGMWAGAAQPAVADAGLSAREHHTIRHYQRGAQHARRRMRSALGALLQQTDQPPQARWSYSPINRRPAIAWPNGARVAFWIGYNIEYFEPGRPSTSITSSTANRDPDPRTPDGASTATASASGA